MFISLKQKHGVNHHASSECEPAPFQRGNAFSARFLYNQSGYLFSGSIRKAITFRDLPCDVLGMSSESHFDLRHRCLSRLFP